MCTSIYTLRLATIGRCEPSEVTGYPPPTILIHMAHSLPDGCTPLKHEYDFCFDPWFEAN